MESVSDFITIVRRHAARLSRSTELEPRTVQREIEAIPNPEVTTALLEHACGSGADETPPEPHERLLQALVLRRAIEGTEHELRWRAPLTYEAAAALQQLRSIVTLYPLRLELLDDLIAHGGPPELLAEWYYARGNTHCVLAGTPASPAAIEDFRRALVHAVDARHGDMLASSTLAFGKSVAALPDGVALEYADQARVFVDAALACGLEGFNRAMVLQAHAHLLRKTDPGGAAEALAEAAELVPRHNPFRVELAAEHVSLSRIAGRVVEAAEFGRRYLEQAVDVPQDVDLGMLHLAVSHVLSALGEPAKARFHAQEGLVCFRGRDLHNELRARIQLAVIALNSGQWDALDDQLRLIEAHASRPTPEQRLDVTRIEAAAAKERGRLEQHRESVERSVDLSYDHKERVRTRLERAQLALGDGRPPVDDLDVLLVDAVEHYAASQSIMSLVAGIVCNAPKHPLDKPTLNRVAAWAVSHQHFTVLAHIQHRGGDTEGARETLRRALELPLSDHERLGCIHLLVCLLEDDGYDERKRLHPELERMLGLDDAPSFRIDLATSLQRDATRDRDALPRAWYHAHRAWQSMHTERSLLPQEQATLAHTCETAARILLSLLQSRLPESSPAIAELVGWLETDLPFSDRGGFRLLAARMLLHPGPLCHPAVVERARRLVSLAKRDLGDAEGIEAASRRLDWISTYLDTGTPAPAPADGVDKPFDAAPRWLVDAIAGRTYEVVPRDLVEHLELLHQALLARLDVADLVLARLLPSGDAMAPPDRARLHDLALAVVQRIHWEGAESRPWAALQRVAGTMAASDGSPGMQALVATIARARGEVPPPTADTTSSSETEEDPERIGAWFERAIALMERTNDAEAVETPRSHIDEARSLLARAVRAARRHTRPELFKCLVSLGNAWKTNPDADLDQALTYYTQAAELPQEPDQEGQLCKVKGDALLQRGAPADVREAEKLLERAAQLRSGRFKAEALASLAKALKRHPDLSQELRLQRSPL